MFFTADGEMNITKLATSHFITFGCEPLVPFTKILFSGQRLYSGFHSTHVHNIKCSLCYGDNSLQIRALFGRTRVELDAEEFRPAESSISDARFRQRLCSEKGCASWTKVMKLKQRYKLYKISASTMKVAI